MSSFDLEKKVNSVINTRAFIDTLAAYGYDLIEFQCEWSNYRSIDEMPEGFARAIYNGEKELINRIVA